MAFELAGKHNSILKQNFASEILRPNFVKAVFISRIKQVGRGSRRLWQIRPHSIAFLLTYRGFCANVYSLLAETI